MRYKIFFLVLILLFSHNKGFSESLTQYVDPNIGTAHCRWFFYTPAAMPFGMAKLGPSTNAHIGNQQGWEATGYDTRDSSIEGFACLHEFQVGGIVLAPSTGELKTIPGDLEHPDEGYRSRFDRTNEKASSGYYSVFLSDYRIEAELTATDRVGYQRYKFPESTRSNIIFDIGNRQGESGKVIDAYVNYTQDGYIEGYVVTEPEYVKKYQKGATVSMYFSALVDKKPMEWGTFRNEEIFEGGNSLKGPGAGMYLSFQTTKDEKVTVKIGLSYTSTANARLNLSSEATNLNFDQALQRNKDTWEEYLGRILVKTKSKVDKVKFYTGLFHALLGRGLASDVNGSYPMNNGESGQIPCDTNKKLKFNFYNSDAIWGGFWNLTQLWALAYPEYYKDWIESQIQIYKDAGWLGDGVANSKYVSGVGTNFTGLAIASAYNCGIRDFDVEAGYKATIKNELESKDRIAGAGKLDVQIFAERGYSPYLSNIGYESQQNGSGFGASHTLEYSYSAFAAAQFAKSLGKMNDYKRLSRLADGWKNLYDPTTKYIRPREQNGNFIEPFNPFEPWRGFQEGNAMQYTFYVPHAPKELVKLIGQENFNNRLDSIFKVAQSNVFGGGKTIDAFAGVKAIYNHGNQPNLHISWLFNYSGKPSLTQKWVRAICNEFYGTEAIHGYGYGQDEDQGQLGSWYVMSSIGLFDVKGLTELNPTMQVGSPLFDEVKIKLSPKYHKGKFFTIKTVNNSDESIYVKDAILNDKKLKDLSIKFKDITSGGTLTLIMDDMPKDQLIK